MFSKSFTIAALLLSFTAQAYAHAAVSPVLGVSGTPVRGDVQRPKQNSPCGKTDVASNIDTSTPVVAAADGSFTMTITNFNRLRDGSRQVTMTVDPTGTGNPSSFVAGTVTKNGDPRPKALGSEQITANLPAGTTCTGGKAGNLCVASFKTLSGFGNCVVVQQDAGGAAAGNGTANADANNGTATDNGATNANANNGTAADNGAANSNANTGTNAGTAANSGAGNSNTDTNTGAGNTNTNTNTNTGAGSASNNVAGTQAGAQTTGTGTTGATTKGNGATTKNRNGNTNTNANANASGGRTANRNGNANANGNNLSKAAGTRAARAFLASNIATHEEARNVKRNHIVDWIWAL